MNAPTKVITVTPAVRAIQRKLEQAELEHLRQHASDLATRLEISEERAQQEAANADTWREFAQELQEELHELALAAGETIGITQTGEVGVIATQPDTATATVQIGDKWPGTDALYAGLSLSSDNTRPVHLIVWPETDSSEMKHADATAAAAAVNPDMASHLPTRTQAIALHENLRAHFDKTWYWTATTTESGKAAFIQHFGYGNQHDGNLSAECRVRAVSEIQL